MTDTPNPDELTPAAEAALREARRHRQAAPPEDTKTTAAPPEDTKTTAAPPEDTKTTAAPTMPALSAREAARLWGQGGGNDGRPKRFPYSIM